MAVNFPGPYEIEMKYTVDGITHIQRLNCDLDAVPTIGQDPTTINVVFRNTLSGQLQSNVSAWATLLAPLYDTTVTFDSYILWSYAPLSFTRTYVTTGTLGISGTNVSAYTPAHQKLLTFRTQEGGIMRINALETSSSGKVIVPYASAGPVTKDIMDFVVSPVGWILARDTSYPIIPLNQCDGENEVTFRQRYRQ